MSESTGRRNFMLLLVAGAGAYASGLLDGLGGDDGMVVGPGGGTDELYIASGDTHTIESGETEAYEFAEIDGTLEANGLLEVA